ncbi:SMI1/KNR4 family protein [Pseudoalteromonas distincta]|uniref:SMI1/KNR4 family protein n=1 Tax=Pseudoalteromonas distincta TaxID=77608 RepID=UPI0023411627|nr:SMI1/KNR4 family protein [Pseudoalteromonas distincta]MDC3214799.1 SMI1/KNR4 family protein [Pseudoalteromonas distincta]
MAFNLEEKFLLQAEVELDAVLPKNYKTSMQESNGGEIEVAGDVWVQYPIFDTSDRKRIARTCNHIIAETKSCEGFGNFPNNALAIAGNGSGDQLVLIKQNNSYTDSIYVWSHETGLLDKVANDFHELTCL